MCSQLFSSPAGLTSSRTYVGYNHSVAQVSKVLPLSGLPVVWSGSPHPTRTDSWPIGTAQQGCWVCALCSGEGMCGKKEKLILKWLNNSGKVSMNEKEELHLSKGLQNENFLLSHWSLASSIRLKGLTSAFKPYDIHMCPPTLSDTSEISALST